MAQLEITDFDSLRDAITDYAHAPHLTDRAAVYFIPLANIRIGRDLRSLSNEKTELYDDVPSPLVLPLDFGQIRNVTFQGQRGPQVLESRSANTLWPLQQTFGGTPRFYNVQLGSVILAPSIKGNYEVNYFNIPEVTASQTTDPALTAFPMLFLYAGLLELNVWTRDAVARSEAMLTYTSEIKAINKNQSRARADSPAGVATPW